jgi:hypothetical protein
MKNLIKKLSLITALLFGSIPGTASAACDGCVVNAIAVSTSTLVTALQTVQGAIVDALRGNTQAVAAAQAKGSQQVADAVHQAAAQKAIDDTAARYQHPDECAAIAATESMGSATNNPGGGATGGGRNSAGLGRGAGISSATREANDTSNKLAPAKAPEIQAAQSVKGACTDYADGFRAEDCKASGLGGGSIATGLPDADIRAETILDGPQKSAGRIARRLTIKAGTVEASAVDSYMRNLNTPIELRQLTRSELQSQAGRQYLSFRDSYEARMSLAEKPIRAMNSRRLNDRNSIAQLNILQQSPTAGAYVAQYLRENAPNWATDGVSTDELVNIEVMRKYMNANWQTQVAAMSPEARQTELLLNSAFQNYLMWRLIQATELNGVVQSQAVSAGVRTEMTPQLNSLHGLATAR